MRQLSFLLGNARQLARYYHKTVLSGILFAVVAAVATGIKDLGLDTHPYAHAAYLICQYGLLAVFLVLVVWATVDLFWCRLQGSGLIQNRLLLDAYYYANGNYTLLKRVECINDSHQPVKELLEIREGYHEEPSKVTAVCGTLPNDSSYAIELSEEPMVRRQQHNVAGVTAEVFKYEWHAAIKPPIQPHKEFGFFLRIAAQGVERAAFQPQGTLFSWIVGVTTKELVIAVHPPCGFSVRLIDYSVADENGDVVKSEKRAVRPPETIADGTVVHWHILLPRTHLRYGLRYSLAKIED